MRNIARIVVAGFALLSPTSFAVAAPAGDAVTVAGGSSTSVDEPYRVPGGVRLVLVEAFGAPGGGPSGIGGTGGFVRAALPVSPGGLLRVIVGYAGPNGPGAGGGGGTNGGASGGGASGVRQCKLPDTLEMPDTCGGLVPEPALVIAGGGGGAGGGADRPAVCGVSARAGGGGASGSLVQTGLGVVMPGVPGQSMAPSSPAGAGGSSGGVGGKAAVCTDGGTPYDNPADGSPGLKAYGGHGADFAAGSKSSPVPNRHGGGGGGGGYWGGGGGSSGQEDASCPDTFPVGSAGICQPSVSGAGGGGGSSFVAAGVTLLAHGAADHAQTPRVVMTPLVVITRPLEGARYRRGRSLAARVRCALERCRAPRRINTSKPGRRTFVVSGVLNGKRLRTRVAYTVVPLRKPR